MITYSQIKAGDTLKVVGNPHYDEHKNIAVERDAIVMVEEVHPAGVTVKTKEGRLVEFYFEHGADKLEYTPETKKAIEDRENFGKVPRAQAGNGDYDVGFAMGRNGQALEPSASLAKKQGYLDGQTAGSSKRSDEYNAGFDIGKRRQTLGATASADRRAGYLAGMSAGNGGSATSPITAFSRTPEEQTALEERAKAANRSVEEQIEFESGQ